VIPEIRRSSLVSQIVDARKVTSEAMMEAMGINTTAMVAVFSRDLLAVLVHRILIPPIQA
jgi:hypothetical protein